MLGLEAPSSYHHYTLNQQETTRTASSINCPGTSPTMQKHPYSNAGLSTATAVGLVMLLAVHSQPHGQPCHHVCELHTSPVMQGSCDVHILQSYAGLSPDQSTPSAAGPNQRAPAAELHAGVGMADRHPALGWHTHRAAPCYS